jgi:hypothetical protein
VTVTVLIDRDQRLYKQEISPSVQPPQPLTEEGKLRFADGVVDTRRNRIITVQEDHSQPGEAVNTIAAVCASCQTFYTLVQYPLVSQLAANTA